MAVRAAQLHLRSAVAGFLALILAAVLAIPLASSSPRASEAASATSRIAQTFAELNASPAFAPPPEVIEQFRRAADHTR